MIKNKKILLLPLFISPFTSLISCVYTGDYVDYSHYTKIYNISNKLLESDYKFNDNHKVDSEIDNLNFESIFKYHFSDKMTYDYLNNYVKNPTHKFLKFSLANNLILSFKNGNKLIYDNDEYDLNNINPDINSGYSKSIYLVNSSSANSINNSNFYNNLNNANSVLINLKDVNYVDKNGQLTSFKLQAHDFINSFFSPKNVAYRTKIEQLYKIEFNANDNTLEIISHSNKLGDFIFEEFTKNLIFNPISSEFLNQKNTQIDDYKPTLNDKLFLTPYVLSRNAIDKQVYIKNKYYNDLDFVQNKKNISQITLKFQSIPIDNETYRIQLFRAYRQRLVSETSLNNFNSSQQSQITNNPSLYGLQNVNNIVVNQSQMSYFYNSKLNLNLKNDFNNTYLKLIYGCDESFENYQSNFFYSNNDSYLFRLYINEIVNQYFFAQMLNQSDIIKTFAFPYTNFYKNEDHSNYNSVADALLWIDSYKIPNLENNEKILNITLNNKIASRSFDNIFDTKTKMSNYNFSFIQANLKKMLDKFFLENNLDTSKDKISWTLPILEPQNEFLINAYSKLKEFYQWVDPRLDFNYRFVGNDYFNEYNSAYKNEKILYESNKLSDFVFNILSDNDFKSALLQGYWSNLYPILNDFILILKTNQDYDLKVNEYLENLETFKQIELINALSALKIAPITHKNVITLNSFEQEIVQPFYVKPLSDLGYYNFEDIKVIK